MSSNHRLIYRQPSQIRMVAWLFNALITFIFAMLLSAYFSGVEMEHSAMIGIPLLFLPFYIGCWWLLWQYRGRFIINNEGIHLSRVGKSIFVPFADIESLQEQASQFIPYLEVSAGEQNLHISSKVERYDELIRVLRSRVSNNHDSNPIKPLPLLLRYPEGYGRQAAIWVAFYVLFTGVLSFGVYFEGSVSIWLSAGLWLLFLAIAGFLLLLSESVSPYAVDITEERIEARYWFRRDVTIYRSDIVKIERERQVRHIRYTTTMTVYPIVIHYQEGERLQLEEDRIWAFGSSPERLLAILHYHYQR